MKYLALTIFLLSTDISAYNSYTASMRNREFKKIWKEFVKDFPHARKITYEFIDGDINKKNTGVIGNCIPYRSFKKIRPVKFKMVWWDHASMLNKRALVYHELGHCILDMSHGRQGTLMGPKLPRVKNKIHWKYLVKEMKRQYARCVLGYRQSYCKEDYHDN